MSSRSDDRDEMARDLPGVCSSATNCLTHVVDPDGTVWLSSTRRPDRLRVDPDEWVGRPAALGGLGELADARHELDVLRGGITDFSERLDLALGDLTQALAERDEARAELAKTVSNFEEFAEAVADRRRPTEAAPGALALDRLRALADAATPGPWKAYDVNEGTSSPPAWSVANDEFFNPHDTDEPAVDIRVAYGVQADAEFIAAAREAVPRLIAEVERLRTTWDDRERLNAELVTAVREAADLRALFDLQWKRMAEATERWRAEDPEPRALVMPDLGDLLRWLMDQRDQAIAELAAATKQGAGWMDEARRQAAERDREFQRAEQAEARLAALEPHARDAGVRLLELQAERGELALALEQVTAERDRRGDELRRAQGQALDRATVKPRVHQALHDLNVRIAGLDKGDCHCNLIAEVVLDALDHGEVVPDAPDAVGM